MADYIDRQAAIAALRKFAEDCKGSTEAATAAAMAISVISRLPGPWVSAEERKPVLHKWIFLRVGIGGVVIGSAYVGHGGVIGYADDNGEKVTGVTGWMELPDATNVVGIRNTEQSEARYADNPTMAAEYNRDVAENFLAQQAENVKDWAPVLHGTWDGKTLSTFLSLDHTGAPIYGHSPVYVCSRCERYSLLQTNYCPHCGAKMDGGTDNGKMDRI